MILENIHTIPRAASWNSDGEGEGFLGLEEREGGRGVKMSMPPIGGYEYVLESPNSVDS